MDNYRTSTIILIGSAIIFIASFSPPAGFLDFTAEEMQKAFIGWSLVTGAIAIYFRTVTKD